MDILPFLGDLIDIGGGHVILEHTRGLMIRDCKSTWKRFLEGGQPQPIMD
jgi:hypothetical protein